MSGSRLLSKARSLLSATSLYSLGSSPCGHAYFYLDISLELLFVFVMAGVEPEDERDVYAATHDICAAEGVLGVCGRIWQSWSRCDLMRPCAWNGVWLLSLSFCAKSFGAATKLAMYEAVARVTGAQFYFCLCSHMAAGELQCFLIAVCAYL